MIIAAAGLSACGESVTDPRATAGPAPPPVAHSSSRVAFVVERDHAECVEGCPEVPQIYSVKDRGGKATMLLSGADAPAFSPAGNRLAAHTSSGDVDDLSDSRIIVAQPDGNGAKPLVGGHYPAWSPGADRIAFEKGDPIDVPNRSIYTVSSSRGPLKFLVRGNTPAWSANDMVAFARVNEHDDEVISVIRHPDGKARDLTSGHEDSHPDWSPDGTRIAFDRQFARATWIYSIGADGGGLRRLEEGEQPAWSPDGRRIAFTDGRDVLVMRADGSHVRSIATADSFGDTDIYAILGEPAWIPNG